MRRENTIESTVKVTAMAVVASTGLAAALPGHAAADGAILGASGKCVAVTGTSTANGAPVQLQTCNYGSAQQWSIAGDGAIHTLGKCLDVAGGGTANGTRVQLWDCNGTGAQQWVAPTLNKLVNPQSGRCLDAIGGNTADGTPLQIFDCNGGPAQNWSLPPGGPTTKLYLLSGNIAIPGTPMTPSGNPIELRRTPNFFLHQGESRRVFGQAYVASGTLGKELEYDADVQCIDASTGNQVGSPFWAAKNQIPSNTLGLALTPSLLFTAPQDGMYTCRLQADGEFDQLALASGTWLRMDDTINLSAQQWQDPICDSEGTDVTCTYLGGSGHMTRITKATGCSTTTMSDTVNSSHAFLLDDDCTPRVPWTAPSFIQSADVTATVGLTTCYNGTGSCVDTEQGPRKNNPDDRGSTVSSHLEAVQLDVAGGECNVTATGDQIDFIGAPMHHFTIPYHLANVPVLSRCGSRQFIVRIAMSWLSGDPVKIDGARVYRPDDPNEPRELHTSAFLVGSTDPVGRITVPDVLSFGEQAARNAIAAAGLPIGNVTHTTSCADPGNVLIQHPAAYAVVLPGTPVDLQICDASGGGGGGGPLP